VLPRRAHARARAQARAVGGPAAHVRDVPRARALAPAQRRRTQDAVCALFARAGARAREGEGERGRAGRQRGRGAAARVGAERRWRGRGHGRAAPRRAERPSDRAHGGRARRAGGRGLARRRARRAARARAPRDHVREPDAVGRCVRVPPQGGERPAERDAPLARAHVPVHALDGVDARADARRAPAPPRARAPRARARRAHPPPRAVHVRHGRLYCGRLARARRAPRARRPRAPAARRPPRRAQQRQLPRLDRGRDGVYRAQVSAHPRGGGQVWRAVREGHGVHPAADARDAREVVLGRGAPGCW
ncbi:hypothetical protein WOLCODRAFT_166963, partial [Wolfiporia cocos MD-104 SS10]